MDRDMWINLTKKVMTAGVVAFILLVLMIFFTFGGSYDNSDALFSVGLGLFVFSMLAIAAGMIMAVMVSQIYGTSVDRGDYDGYSYEKPNEESNNKDKKSDYFSASATSRTEGSPDKGYKCTISRGLYGSKGFGRTAEEAEKEARLRDEWLTRK